MKKIYVMLVAVIIYNASVYSSGHIKDAFHRASAAPEQGKWAMVNAADNCAYSLRSMSQTSVVKYRVVGQIYEESREFEQATKFYTIANSLENTGNTLYEWIHFICFYKRFHGFLSAAEYSAIRAEKKRAALDAVEVAVRNMYPPQE